MDDMVNKFFIDQNTDRSITDNNNHNIISIEVNDRQNLS